MFGSKHITRKARRALTIGLLAASFAAPAAHANDGLVDDWFRDPQVVPMASIGLIDVTAKESSRPIASVATVSTAHDRLVDDWFRNQQLVPMASIGLIDVTAKESSRPIAVPQVITTHAGGQRVRLGGLRYRRRRDVGPRAHRRRSRPGRRLAAPQEQHAQNLLSSLQLDARDGPFGARRSCRLGGQLRSGARPGSSCSDRS